MSKKFVVALHGAPSLRDPITEYLLAQSWHVWHWYADFWLISGVPDTFTAHSLHTLIESCIPTPETISMMTIEMGPELRYYGRAPKAEAWDWMKEHWGKADLPNPP